MAGAPRKPSQNAQAMATAMAAAANAATNAAASSAAVAADGHNNTNTHEPPPSGPVRRLSSSSIVANIAARRGSGQAIEPLEVSGQAQRRPGDSDNPDENEKHNGTSTAYKGANV